MESHYQLNDTEFETQFANGLLDPALFTHEAHLRLAWIHLDKSTSEKAIAVICYQLYAYVSSLGAAEKYNETVTIAAIMAVHHFKLRSATDNFRDFIQENPRLKTDFRGLLACHYTTDIFTSDTARKQFLEPELLPFD